MPQCNGAARNPPLSSCPSENVVLPGGSQIAAASTLPEVVYTSPNLSPIFATVFMNQPSLRGRERSSFSAHTQPGFVWNARASTAPASPI